MNGWDFSILWEAGRAILDGTDPYAVGSFFYPLPVAYFFALFALLPYKIAFGLWLALNAALFIYFFRRLVWVWILYAPVMHLFSAGQVEMIFWSLERLLHPGGESESPGWRGAILVALITLKPQTALVLLPWHGFRWLRHDRPMIIRAGIATAALWSTPMLWRPRWILDWREALPPRTFLTFAGNTTGFWSLVKVVPDLWPLALMAAVLVMAWGIWQNNPVTRACALLATPFGLFYSSFALLGTAPARLLVPLSLFAAGSSLALHNFIPFIALPLAVIIWHRRFKPAELPDDLNLPPGHLYQFP